MPRLTNKQQAMKALDIAKAKELAKGAKPNFIKQGVNGQKLTGKKHWG